MTAIACGACKTHSRIRENTHFFIGVHSCGHNPKMILGSCLLPVCITRRLFIQPGGARLLHLVKIDMYIISLFSQQNLIRVSGASVPASTHPPSQPASQPTNQPWQSGVGVKSAMAGEKTCKQERIHLYAKLRLRKQTKNLASCFQVVPQCVSKWQGVGV